MYLALQPNLYTPKNKIPDANGNSHRVHMMKRVFIQQPSIRKSNPTIF